jgi:hypothetical protein
MRARTPLTTTASRSSKATAIVSTLRLATLDVEYEWAIRSPAP